MSKLISLSHSVSLSLSLSLQLTWRTFFPFEKDTSHTHTHSWLPAGRHTDRCAASVRAAPRRSFKAARSSSSRSQKALIWIGCETMLPSRWRQQRKTFLNLNSMFIIFLNLEEIYVYYYIFKSVVYLQLLFFLNAKIKGFVCALQNHCIKGPPALLTSLIISGSMKFSFCRDIFNPTHCDNKPSCNVLWNEVH